MAKEKRKRRIRSGHVITVVFLIIIGVQIFAFLLIDSRIQQTLSTLNNTRDALNQKININNQDVQSKINTITSSVTNLSLIQTDLEEELGEVKASASSDFSGIFESEKRGIVTIKTDISQGTGFIITSDGYVVTNDHVVNGASAAGVFTYDTRSHQVRLIGRDQELDIALLKIEGNFDNVDLGDSDETKIGEKVIAIGNPLGLQFTLTEGVISARDRTGANRLPYYFQIDVPINPGNSGGPLINTEGEVIGINNFKVQGAEGLGFALEINEAKEAINSIAEQEINQTIV
jgi:S1-C subfamily serine protease